MKQFFMIIIISCALYSPVVSAMWTQDDLIHEVQELSIIGVYHMVSGLTEGKINEPDSQGRYALHEAIKLQTKDSVDKVIFLLRWGRADAQIEQKGRTALQIAVDEGTAVNGGDAKIRALLRLYYLRSNRKFHTSQRRLRLGGTADTYPVPNIVSKGIYGKVFQDIVAQEREYTKEENRQKRKQLGKELMDIVFPIFILNPHCRLSGSYSKLERDRLEKTNLETAKRLLAEGVSPNAHGNMGYYTFDSVYATLEDKNSKSIALLELLLRKGGKIERVYGNGFMRRPFHALFESRVISFRNKVAKFKLLMDCGININFCRVRSGKACCENSAQPGNSTLEQVFGEDPCYPYKASHDIILTSLFKHAVAQGRSWRQLLPGIAQEFLPGECIPIVGEYAFPYYSDYYNYDAPELDQHNPKKLAHYLMEAMQEYDLEKMEQLLDLGADPYYHRRGMHRLYEALRDPEKKSMGVVQLLVRKGFDVNRTCRGRHPFKELLNVCDNAMKKAKFALLMEGNVQLDAAKLQEFQCNNENDSSCAASEEKQEHVE